MTIINILLKMGKLLIGLCMLRIQWSRMALSDMYSQQPMMGVYGQTGYGQVPAAVYGVAPATQSAQTTAPTQPPSQHPFL